MNEEVSNSGLKQDFKYTFGVDIMTEEKSRGDCLVEYTLNPVSACCEGLQEILVIGIGNVRKRPNTQIQSNLFVK